MNPSARSAPKETSASRILKNLNGDGRAGSGIGGFPHRALLFAAQFTLAPATDQRLGIDSAGLTADDGGENRPVPAVVHHGEGKALGTRHVFESIESYEADMALRALAGLLKVSHSGG